MGYDSNVRSELQEKEFFESIYNRYKLLMYQTARHYTSNQADLEDIMQDSVERLLRKTHKLMAIPSCALAAYIVYTVRKYSLQGTTQGRYLTGGVPPIRFSM